MTDPNPDAAEIPIKLHSQGDLPLYLQIKYQLSYLITAERIPGGARLPPVRTLAGELNVNPHTVAQAYRELQGEGLIQSAPGRGSFVREFTGQERAETERHGLLSALLDAARRRGRTLGFSDEEIVQRLSTLTRQESVPCHLVFVDRVPHIAEKYAGRLEHHLGPAVRATPLALGDLERVTPEARRTLADTYYVVAFARNVPSLERALARHGATVRLLTIVSEVVPETASALGRLPPDIRAVLLTEERYLHSSLNLLAAHSRLDPSGVPAFTPAEWDDFRDAAKEAELVLYTFGVGEAVAALDTDAPKLEMSFDIGPDSVEKLRRTFTFLEDGGTG